MLTADTKRHIDAARQVLVGIVPDPKGQVDQITNALIYKFMDDMDQASLRMKGGKASFFTGDLEMYAWTRLMDPSLGNQGRMNLYVEALAKFGEAKQLPELFRDIFKRAFLPFRDPETLGLFLKEIAYFDYSHSEELGNAYEYLLSIMGSQGDAGQFRTPRHIIDFIVAAVEPTKDDTILDPACGTAGFLISAYKHILANHDGKDENGKPNKEIPLTPDERKRLMEHFEGYDISPDMVRMSQVNLYLHAFKGPKIYEYNTLASEDRWNDKFDVIMANPPFMSPRGGVRPHQRFSVESTRAEVLFVDYIMNHLKPRGRAGVIVPEGIIFQSGIAYKQLRKNLVDDGLYAVVSLPAGVFNPYSGVKTSILLFDRELAKKAKEILFIKATNDGFDLGAQRREHSYNDLPQALEILHAWKKGKKSENVLALYVEKAKIGETGDYNLSADRYRVATDYGTAKWPMVALEEVCELHRGVVYSKEDEVSRGGYKILRANNISLDNSLVLNDVKLISKELKLKENQKLKEGDIFICLASGSKHHIGKVAYIKDDTDFYFGGFMGAIRIKDETITSSYLFHLLKDQKFNDFLGQQISGANINNLNFGILSRYEIPLPPLGIQQKIVAELDGYAAIIAGAKQVTENWGPKIDIDPEWPKVMLGDVVDIHNGSTPKRTEASYWKNGTIPWFTIDDMRTQGRFITETAQKITEKGFKESSVKLLPKETILLCCTASIGEYAFSEIELTTNQQFNGLVVREKNKLYPQYLFWYSSLFKKELERMSGKATFGFVSVGTLKAFEIPLPPLETQKQIVEQIEAERTLVESVKKLIAIYEQKTKETIAKLWSE